MTIDVAEEGEQLGGAVAARVEVEQFRRGVNQRGGRRAGAEDGVVDDVFEEGNVGLDAADAEFAQRAVHALQGDVEIAGPDAVTFTSSES